MTSSSLGPDGRGSQSPWRRFLWISFFIIVAGLAIGYCFARYCRLWFEFTIDDAFISARYAENLARGFGPVYNPGWEPVLGASNVLFVFLLAVLRGFGVGFPLVAKIIGLVSAVGVFGLTAWAAHRSLKSAALAALAVVLLAMNTAFAFWSVGGLETSFYTLLITACWFVFFFTGEVSPRRSRQTAWLAGALGALATMTRVEAVILVFCLLAVSAWSRAWRIRAGWFLLAWAALLTPYLFWKEWFYGGFLPNPAVAKSNFDIAWRQPVQTLRAALAAPHQVRLLVNFLAVNLGLAILALLSVALPGREGYRGDATRPDRGHRFALAGLLFVVVNLLAYLKIWVWMPGHRYYVPFLPVLCVMAALGARRWLDLGLTPRVRAVLAVLMLAALVSHYHRPQAREARQLTKYAGRYAAWQDEEYTPVGEWIARNTAPDALLAIRDAGRIPFLCRRPTLDLGGLNDKDVARIMRLNDTDAFIQYVLSIRPEILVLSNKLEPDRTISSDPRVRESYRLLFKSGSTSSPVAQYNLLVFRRRDAPAPAAYASADHGDADGQNEPETSMPAW